LVEVLAMTPERLSAVMGAVYDCALDPQHWPEALRHIAEVTDSVAAVLGIHSLNVADSTFQFGYDPAHLALYASKYFALNPLIPPLMLAPVGEVLTLASLCDEAEFLESRFYNEWCQPARLLDGLFVKPLHANTLVVLTLNRGDWQPPLGELEVRSLRLIVPHIIRSLTISSAFELQSIAGEALEATIDGLTTAVFLTANDGRLVLANQAGERMLAEGTAVRLADRRLAAVDAQAHSALAQAVAAGSRLAIAARPDNATAASIALPVGAGPGYIATVLPLHGGAQRSLMTPHPATTAIFVQSPQVPAPFPGEAFARLYGLTGGELRVLLALAQGQDPSGAAEMLGIGESTVRTHLLRIFAKTGTHRQAELVALLMASTPPVGASS
jgi:DNA-binding CsgD family transcriptional regulator/PAS domain-containing protein